MRNMFSSRSWSTDVVGWLLAVALGGGVSGCTPVADEPSSQLAADPSALSGEFITYVADFDDGHSERWQTLRQTDGHEIRLDFDATPPFTSGNKIRVRGDLIAEKRLHVTAFEPVAAGTVRVGGALSAEDPELIAAPATETYAIVLVDLGAGVNMTAAQAQARLNSSVAADRSFGNYYAESSYGKYSVAPTSTVLGPYPFAIGACDTSGMATAIEGMIGATTVAQYNHLIYYFNRSTACTFGGLGEEGSSTRPSKRTWMNGSLTCVVLMQEPGHNLGLMHANTMNCMGTTFSATPASCTITEYGSQLTTMGGGCRVLNGYERWYMQWFAGCNGTTVKGNGDFNLLPIETPCPGGVQTLQIPFPAALTVSDPQSTGTAVSLRNFYLELRTQAGNYDTYAAAGGGGAGRVTFSAPTVFLYTSDNVRAPAATGRGQNSVWTELLNTTPSGTAFTGFTAAGQSFTDPASGLVITLKSISATGATVTVSNNPTTGTATCMDGTALPGNTGPASCGAVVTGQGGSTGAAGAAGAAGGTAGAPGTGGRGAGGMTGGGVAGMSGGGAGSPGSTGTGGSTGSTGPVTGGTGGKILGPTVDAGSPETGIVTGGCGCSIPSGSQPLWSGLVGAIVIGLLRRRRRLNG
jgi:MYXO-CTERM domain-containing protein